MNKQFYILSNNGNIPHFCGIIAATNGKNALKRWLDRSCLLKSAYTIRKQYSQWIMENSAGHVVVAQEV